ncbi:MAG: hypothetical protein CMI56_02605 [Parcubacteria group bacterium]|nr:hypothetical protein [Parcubacteria group bacterium]|tara:strand:- start:4309 stop:4830 length:522 start_codon:yes stop_codon:yes gene_type:complete
MLPGQVADFEKAVASVENEERKRDPNFVIDRTLSAAIIDTMRKLAGGKQMGNQFRQLRDSAMNEMGIDDLFEWYIQKLVIGRFFNPRAVRAKKRPQLCVVKEASADSVTIQVYPEISIVFGTKKNGHEKPDWGDVVVIRREVESGSPFIGDHHFQRAKKTALAAMRSYQKQKY